MKRVRKIDYYGQLILGSFILLSIPVLLVYGFLAGLFIPGCWQLLSAVFNTKAFIHTGHSKQIGRYWSCCLADTTILFLGWYFGKTFKIDNVQVFYWVAVSGAVFIAVYYLKIYNGLIQFFSLRDELDGLTRSKH
jgi:hypothetical protein